MKTELMACADGERRLLFWCPGCKMSHGPIVTPAAGGPVRPCWQWNGDRERPTLSPSIRVQGTVRLTDDEIARVLNGEVVTPVPLLCHSFVRDGMIQFLSDCTHALAGQTVAIPEWED